MSDQNAPQADLGSPTRVEFKVEFSRGTKGRRRAQPGRQDGEKSMPRNQAKAAGRVPKITRLLVLGHHFERLVREEKVKDYAEIARLTGLTRARITQIVNLTLLAPKIQERILNLVSMTGDPDPITERALRRTVILADWRRQERLLMSPD